MPFPERMAEEEWRKRNGSNNNGLCITHIEERTYTAVEYLAGRSPAQKSPLRRLDSLSDRKLVLHFDVRNTILVADSVTKIPIEDRLNTYLTTVAWGHENDKGDWEWDSTETSLICPVEGAEPYYKYLEGKFVKNPGDRGLLRDITGNFTNEEVGAPFKPAFDEYLKLLEWSHDHPDPQFTRTGRTGQHYHYFLPSFLNLVSLLTNTNRDFAIVFRTFGMDAHNAILTMEHFMNKKHPSHQKLESIRDLPVNTTPGSVRRSKQGDIRFEKFDTTRQCKCEFQTEREIYQMLSSSVGFQAFKDDFHFWQDHGYHYTAGKPVWLDPSDTDVHHIFFDDHVRLSETDNIVDLRLFVPGADVARSVTAQDIRDLRDVCVVQLDLLHAIRDPSYFINKLQTCELNFERLVTDSLSHCNSPCDEPTRLF